MDLGMIVLSILWGVAFLVGWLCVYILIRVEKMTDKEREAMGFGPKGQGR